MPEPMKHPVSLRGTMTPEGYRPENVAWRDELLTVNADGRKIGKNPLEIDLEILKAAGHPPRSAQQALSAWGASDREDLPRGAKGIREFCLGCSSGSTTEVRECRVYNCPCWPYRMGRNPFDSRRGQRPTFGK